MFDLRELLKEVGDRASRATEGPWLNVGLLVCSTTTHEDIADTVVEPVNPQQLTNADFIAHARTDVPALVAALEAVLELHRPVHRVFSWNSGVRDEEPCPDCHGKAGVHECGCWADIDITYSCAECRSEKGGGVDCPCPTVQAVTKALGVDQ